MAGECPDGGPVVLPEARTVSEKVLAQRPATSHHLRPAHHEEDVVEEVGQQDEGHPGQRSAAREQRKLQQFQIEGGEVDVVAIRHSHRDLRYSLSASGQSTTNIIER